MIVQQFLAEKQIPLTPQPLYPPDLEPCDFWRFPRLRMGLRGQRFATIEHTKHTATVGVRAIPKEAFQHCFQEGQNR
jgi:hypothetical protein